MVWTHTTNIGQDKGWIRNLIRYATNESKTENGRFCEFVNCTPDTATEYFELLLNQKNYLSGHELKGGVFHTIISHEMSNDDISDAECEKIYKNQDINSVKEWVKKQDKNPDDYAFLYAGHRDTNRDGDHGQFHGHVVLLAVNINDISAPLIRDDKANRYLLQDVVMEHFPNETTITRNYKKEMEYRKNHPKEKFTNQEVVFPNSATPETHVLTSQSAKRRWEYVISAANLSPTQRKRELLKTDIDDAIETVKENYRYGKSNYCDYKSFLKEMNKRGYSYRQNRTNSKSEFVKFTHKNWPQYTKNGKPETIYYQFKELGYSKTDIEKRINFEMSFTPPEPSIYVWNEIEEMPKNKRLRKQAEYINFCNIRRACRQVRFVNYLFGGGLVGLLAGVLLALLIKATMPKAQDIYKQLNKDDYNRRIKKMVVFSQNENKTQPIKANESVLETKKHTMANVNGLETVRQTEENGVAGFATPSTQTAVAGFATAKEDKSAAGLAAEKVQSNESEFIKNEEQLLNGKGLFLKSVYQVNDLLEERDSYPKNTPMRKDINSKILSSCAKLGEDYPNFKKYVGEELKLEFKPKNIISNFDIWLDNYSSDSDLLTPLRAEDGFNLDKLKEKQNSLNKKETTKHDVSKKEDFIKKAEGESKQKNKGAK